MEYRRAADGLLSPLLFSQVRVGDDVAIRHVEHIDAGVVVCRHAEESSDDDGRGRRGSPRGSPRSSSRGRRKKSRKQDRNSGRWARRLADSRDPLTFVSGCTVLTSLLPSQ